MMFKDTPADRCPKCNAAIDPAKRMCERCWHRRNDRKGKNEKFG